jgi:hypothetical protein
MKKIFEFLLLSAILISMSSAAHAQVRIDEREDTTGYLKNRLTVQGIFVRESHKGFLELTTENYVTIFNPLVSSDGGNTWYNIEFDPYQTKDDAYVGRICQLFGFSGVARLRGGTWESEMISGPVQLLRLSADLSKYSLTPFDKLSRPLVYNFIECQ